MKAFRNMRVVQLVALFAVVTACSADVDGDGPLGSVMQALSYAAFFDPGRSVSVAEVNLGGSGTFSFPSGGTGGGSGSSTVVAGNYNGATDSLINAAAPTTNYEASGHCNVDGAGPARACLMRWDLSDIPTTVTVKGVFLYVHLENGTTGTFNVYEVLKSWTEAQVTWNQAKTGTNWGTPGAKGATDRGSTSLGTLTGGAGVRTIAFSADGVAKVQSWVSNPATNLGFIIAGSSSDGIHISSTEAIESWRPQLVVTYSQ